MACRVGMSTNPSERIQYWKNKEGYSHGMILVSGLTYSEAHDRERTEALNRGCAQSPGGAFVSGRVWSVYYVWHGS